jgi:hypothetical protein
MTLGILQVETWTVKRHLPSRNFFHPVARSHSMWSVVGVFSDQHQNRHQETGLSATSSE